MAVARNAHAARKENAIITEPSTHAHIRYSILIIWLLGLRILIAQGESSVFVRTQYGRTIPIMTLSGMHNYYESIGVLFYSKKREWFV